MSSSALIAEAIAPFRGSPQLTAMRAIAIEPVLRGLVFGRRAGLHIAESLMS